MAENPTLAFLQQALSVNGANAPAEETALFNLFMQRLIVAGLLIDSSGNITAPFITANPNVTSATGTLTVPHGGTGATTLTGVLKGNGTGAVTAVSGTSAQVVHGDASVGAVVLTTDVSGTLPVGNGGVGAATLAAHGVVIGNGTSAVAVTTPGTAGQVFVSNGASADPTFQDFTGLDLLQMEAFL